MKNLKNKVLIITGAGSGIGRALALHLAQEGALLALNDWNKETLQATVDLLGQEKVRVYSQVFDVSDRPTWELFAKKVNDHFGHIDGIFNNAGITTFPETIPETDPIDFSRLIEINLWGVIHGSQVVIPYLLKQKESLLVNVSSLLGLMGYAGQGAYVTSKFAVRGFTETLRQELVGTGALVTAVHPGPVKTNLTRNIKYHDQDLLNRLSQFFDDSATTTPEEAAEIIIKGIKKGKHRVLLSPRTKMLDRLTRLLPNSYHRFLPRNFRPGHLIKKALAKRAAEKKDTTLVK
ncbi:MAG: SDR family NAD(P)-dependent oxidoreductase [Lewinella sp.]|jgi:butyryl-CoA dehydrogenase|uniref:SDR family NAD(P)-dependent oxidoreductase n=1 Tax=Lewinella sp. TaxID=2004506 RepID=UPI003D6B31EF